LMWLGWKRPFWGGLFLIVAGVLASRPFVDASRGVGWLAPFLIIGAPLLVSGVLLLGAARLERRIV
jgi:hypothetical protein